MQKVSLYKTVSFIAVGLFSFAGTALADGEWSTVSGTSNVFNTNLGNVGIGIMNPDNSRLHVAGGNVNLDDNFAIAWGGGTSRPGVRGNKASQALDVISNGYINFMTVGTDRMRIDANGNVGIGTANPECKLDIRYSGPVLKPFRIYDERVPAFERGGYLDLGGFSDNALTTITSYARIRSGKANATSGDTKGILYLYTDRGAGLVEAMRIDSTGNVGVGTAIPGAPLEVKRDGGPPDTTGGGIIIARSHVDANYRGGAIYSRYINSVASDALVFGVTSDNAKNPYSDFDQARMAICANGRVGIGTMSPQSTLAVNGTITTKKVKVTEVGWSDFVFADDYKLPSLAAVESHIKQYKHLPGIPSAREIQKKGLDVSDVLAKQMQKIEELTLYMIEMKKENQDLKARIKALEEK